MKTVPIVAAEPAFNAEGLAFSTAFDDVYQPHADPFLQARQVFLAGSGLPGRWQERGRFVVLETGFGLGNNFLATWDAWREDPQRCERLVFVSIERHPWQRDDLAALHADSPLRALATQLVDAWPPLTANLHRLAFEGGRVELLLAFGDVDAWLPELVMRVDAFFLDGFAPAKNPQMWQPRLYKALARLAAPGATVATWTAAGAVRQGLASAGFEVAKLPGSAGKRHVTQGRYAPAFTPRRAPSRNSAALTAERRAVIVGAGLAGCASAMTLARQGWQVTLLDRCGQPAGETSGNPAGLFHGIVNAQDGTHARFNRAAALCIQRVVAELLARDSRAGSLQGLLRLEHTQSGSDTMTALLARIGMPADYVTALSAAEASRRCGLPLPGAAWFYPGGGWVRPAALARHFLEQAGALATFRGDTQVDRLERAGDTWRLLAADGSVIDEAGAIVLANAGDALRLLGAPGWPIEPVRGQLSSLPADALAEVPRIPVAGSGYLLPPLDGRLLFGATTQAGDMDPSVRAEDHLANLEQLAQLLGHPIDAAPACLQGRTGWRWVARDRLPLIGAVPDPQACGIARPLDQPRWVPRRAGLYVFTALGSRGITWSALGAEVLASWVTGSPSPLESSLLDAVDPARFTARDVRRGGP